MLSIKRGMFDTKAREVGTWKGRLVLAGEIGVSRGDWC